MLFHVISTIIYRFVNLLICQTSRINQTENTSKWVKWNLFYFKATLTKPCNPEKAKLSIATFNCLFHSKILSKFFFSWPLNHSGLLFLFSDCFLGSTSSLLSPRSFPQSITNHNMNEENFVSWFLEIFYFSSLMKKCSDLPLTTTVNVFGPTIGLSLVFCYTGCSIFSWLTVMMSQHPTVM